MKCKGCGKDLANRIWPTRKGFDVRTFQESSQSFTFLPPPKERAFCTKECVKLFKALKKKKS